MKESDSGYVYENGDDVIRIERRRRPSLNPHQLAPARYVAIVKTRTGEAVAELPLNMRHSDSAVADFAKASRLTKPSPGQRPNIYYAREEACLTA
jgi:hypothetical protein